ncbi:MAG TPA: glycosyltransferase N-terminal domain-containing protein [Candidatus Rifleibacterium sp.]|nr:glycosyltransferase N-terminal domain-containing protein [Candidatus Rifleibacterium sp.]
MEPEMTLRARMALNAYRLLHGLAFIPAAASLPVLEHYSRRLATGLSDYLGNVPRAEKPTLWIHGVSMGESMVAAGFAAELRRHCPDYQIAFTTTHPDVYASFIKRKTADLVAYFPLDNLIAMRRIFDRWKPAAVFVAETDFWPEFSWQCHQRNIPLILINGRISEKIASFYKTFKGFSELVFSAYSLLAVQTPADAARLDQMGVDAAQIKVLGNMKADLTPQRNIDLQLVARWAGNRRCLVLGSLHPDEFKLLKPVFGKLLDRQTALIVAPRNPSHASNWLDELRQIDQGTMLRSQLGDKSAGSILLLDTMGELAGLYALADAAFVGGSLDSSVGGHNPLEVMQQHVPLVMGRHCRNFADIVEQLHASGGISLVGDAEQFATAMASLLLDAGSAEKMVAAADAVLEKNRGCLARTLEAALTAAHLT